MALRYTYFHWGFNGWAMYAVMGGAMAYFGFRKNQPILVSATFTPRPRTQRDQAPDRPADRRPGDRGHPVRDRHLPRPQRAAAQQRPRLPLRRPQVEHGGRAHHHRGHDAVPDLGHVRCREGHQLPGEPGRVRDDRAVPLLPLPRWLHRAGHLERHRVDRQLRHPGAADVAADRRGRRAVDGRLDDLLLGLVGVLGALRRHVRRPHLARAHHPRVHRRRGRGADRASASSGSRSWAASASSCSAPARPTSSARSRPRSCPCSRRWTCCRSR